MSTTLVVLILVGLAVIAASAMLVFALRGGQKKILARHQALSGFAESVGLRTTLGPTALEFECHGSFEGLEVVVDVRPQTYEVHLQRQMARFSATPKTPLPFVHVVQARIPEADLPKHGLNVLETGEASFDAAYRCRAGEASDLNAVTVELSSDTRAPVFLTLGSEIELLFDVTVDDDFYETERLRHILGVVAGVATASASNSPVE